MIRQISEKALLWMICLCVSISTGYCDTATNQIKRKDWWSLKPVVRPALPDGPESNPIDRFINAEIKHRGLKAVGPADKLTLLRRVYLDLIGIPPTPAEHQAFLADASPEAYEKVVDQLLANEQHAVRYARHWLDVLRYADADEHLTAAPGMHLWRDWVIKALHDDVPYDQFVQIQLTGQRSSERTEISALGYRSHPEPRPGDEFALGFLARGAGENPQDLAIAAADTVSTAFMGMTAGCAKCHDHMYDPISQRDFYALKALFDPLVPRKVTLANAAEIFAFAKAREKSEKRSAPLRKAVDDFAKPYKDKLYEERVVMLPDEIQAVIHKPEKQRTVAEQKIADDYFPVLRIDEEKITNVMPADAFAKYEELKKKLKAEDPTDAEHPGPSLPVFYTVAVDREREREKSYILTTGDPLRPEKDHEVKPGWPFETSEPDFREGRIQAFVDWLTAPENPLFARVAVNRLWQWHFGEGLVKIPSDFGRLGGPPSNPALLDWLASEFTRQGYSLRQMHRLMVTSDAYKRESEAGDEFAESEKLDPTDNVLWHFRLQRLEAEPIWDSMHFAAGDLDLSVGGPSFGMRKDTAKKNSPEKPDDDSVPSPTRRAAYLARGYSSFRELMPHFLPVFDVDDGRVPCPLRTQTVTAPQALFLMNSPDVDKACVYLAARLQKEAKGDLPAAVTLAYRVALSRPPSTAEKNNALAYLESDPARLKQFSWLMFNLDEFIYVR